MKKSLLILLFTCWALFFAAFRPVMPFAAETAAFPDGTPVTGGRILMGTIGEPSNLIPYMASDSASGEITGLLYVAPLKYDKDLNVVPWAAASYEVLEGGRLLRFVLRDDIRWEDGVPLTADDVEFTYKLMIDPKTPTAYSGDFLAIESFKKTGRLSFEVRYAKPFARSLMTWMGAILPKHVLEGQDIMTTPVARKPIGAGPYRLAKWDAGSMLTLTASDTYFEGRPNLDEVVYRIIPDPSTMFLELKAGKLDMMSLSPQQYLRQTQGPQWERDWRKYRYLSFSYTFLGFNLEHPFFKDVRVRRAISMAIDRQSLIDGVLLGQGVPTVGPYKPGTWAYNDKLTPVRQDVDEARRLLDEAGWKKNKDGLLERDGKPFLFTILVNQGNDSRIKAAIIIHSQLKALELDTLDLELNLNNLTADSISVDSTDSDATLRNVTVQGEAAFNTTDLEMEAGSLTAGALSISASDGSFTVQNANISDTMQITGADLDTQFAGSAGGNIRIDSSEGDAVLSLDGSEQSYNLDFSAGVDSEVAVAGQEVALQDGQYRKDNGAGRLIEIDTLGDIQLAFTE